MTECTIDATTFLARLPVRRVRRPTSIVLGDHSYGPGEMLAKSWLPTVFGAFSRLAGRMPVRDLLIIGSGSGLDALGAIEIFDLHSVTVTDLTAEGLETARMNIEENLVRPFSPQIGAYAGDLLSCVPSERRFCLIYENLPNIPAPDHIDVHGGSNAASFFAADAEIAPEPFISHLLALHYRCLQQSRSRVRQGGGVLTSIGGRVPLQVVLELHAACGFDPELLVFDAKLQSEPDLIIPAYAKAHLESGIDFAFYDPGILAIFTAAKGDGLEGPQLAAALVQPLQEHRLTALEALARSKRRAPVAHTVFMVLGQPVESTDGT